jgi:hypothetical protein
MRMNVASTTMTLALLLAGCGESSPPPGAGDPPIGDSPSDAWSSRSDGGGPDAWSSPGDGGEPDAWSSPGDGGEPDAAPLHCDARAIRCRLAPPVCGGGEVPSVDGTCWGPCVPATDCTCDPTASCPAGYTCAGVTCVADAAPVQCDPDEAWCRALPPTCSAGHVPSVIDHCWGPCVPVTECACDAAEPSSAACPLPGVMCGPAGTCVGVAR